MTKHTFPLTCNQTHWLVIFVSAIISVIGWNSIFDNLSVVYIVITFAGTIVFGIASLMKLIFYLEDNWKCKCDKK